MDFAEELYSVTLKLAAISKDLESDPIESPYIDALCRLLAVAPRSWTGNRAR